MTTTLSSSVMGFSSFGQDFPGAFRGFLRTARSRDHLLHRRTLPIARQEDMNHARLRCILPERPLAPLPFQGGRPDHRHDISTGPSHQGRYRDRRARCRYRASSGYQGWRGRFRQIILQTGNRRDRCRNTGNHLPLRHRTPGQHGQTAYCQGNQPECRKRHQCPILPHAPVLHPVPPHPACRQPDRHFQSRSRHSGLSPEPARYCVQSGDR